MDENRYSSFDMILGAGGMGSLLTTLCCLSLITVAALGPFLPTFGLFFDHTDDFNFFYPLSFVEYPKLFIPHWSYYRPLPEVFWLLEYRVFDVNPFAYRLAAWFVHLLCVLAVFWLALLLSRCLFLAAGAALITSQQPALDDTIARVGGGIDVLFTLPYVLCLVAYSLHRQRRSGAFLGVSLVLAAASLLSKEMAITLPLALLLMELVFFAARRNIVRMLASAIVRTAPFFVLTAAHVVLFILRPFSAQQGQMAVLSGSELSLMRFVKNAKLLFGSVFAPLWLVAPIVLVGLCLILRRKTMDEREALWLSRLGRCILFAAGLVVLSPIPVLPLPIAAERHSFYLPSIAASLTIMTSLTAISLAVGRKRRWLVGGPLGVLCAILLILNADLRAALHDFIDINRVKGSIPMSLARQVDPAEAKRPIALAFMPGEKVKIAGTEILNFWVSGAKFMLHDAVPIMWVHDYLLRTLWLALPTPEPEFWVCKDHEAQKEPALGEYARELVSYRADLRRGAGPHRPASPDGSGLDSTGPARIDSLVWDFGRDPDAWATAHGRRQPADGHVVLSSDDGIVVLESPPLSIDPWYFSTVTIVAKYGPVSEGPTWRIYYCSDETEGWPESKNAVIGLKQDGNFNSNLIFMLVYFQWGYGRTITRLRLVVEGLEHEAALKSISLTPTVPPPPVIDLLSIAPSAGMKTRE